MLASKIMDEDVVGADNKDIGDVEDLVLDRSGKVVAVVIEVDKGLGDRTVALPLSAIQMNAAGRGDHRFRSGLRTDDRFDHDPQQRRHADHGEHACGSAQVGSRVR